MRSSCERFHRYRRKAKQYKKAKLARKSDTVFLNKNLIHAAFLNVDGLTDVTLASVKDSVHKKLPDIFFLVETKRRDGEVGLDISIPRYTKTETNRSDSAGERDGGGIVVYTRNDSGVMFEHHRPDIANCDDAFVNSERIWMKVETTKFKTAFCGLYHGYQDTDDRHGAQNDTILRVIQEEAFQLRRRGFRVIFLGDFNAHVGCKVGEGVPGNNPDINKNGVRFLNFLDLIDSVHLNGACRIPGNLNTKIAKGLWTRQRCGSKSVLDYAVISKEHLHSVHSMLIDDTGQFSANSDHNWLFLKVTDHFMIQKSNSNIKHKKDRWDIKPDQDWSVYKKHVLALLNTVDYSSIESLASSISRVIINALHSAIGLKSVNNSGPKNLPPEVWKTLNSTSADSSVIREAEEKYLGQKARTNEKLSVYRSNVRSSIMQSCKGNSTQARKNFWSHVSLNKKQSTDIIGVRSSTSGVVKCNPHDIRHEVETHLTNVFQGSFERVDNDWDCTDFSSNDHNYVRKGTKSTSGQPTDHPYSSNPSKCLPRYDSSCSLESDPMGFLNAGFTVSEVEEGIKSLKNGKAKGWDLIPNEALKNLPPEGFEIITLLFNKIKASGHLPKDWNRGRVTLVHKYGARELLGNYRPITVLISMCGLYSKLLNARLMQVVEKHDLLGEIQNGFRPNRSAADNNFILGSIKWKSKQKRSKVHVAFLDISKAYDSVNRGILWKRLSSLGIRGNFLATIQSLYSDDCIDCNVNGLTSRPIYLKRGLRQGCSLSPVLFALYISEVGTDIFLSKFGFYLGNVCISGLLFADDLVIIARSAQGLKDLLKIVKRGFDKLKLSINCTKSQVLSPEDHDWTIFDLTPDDCLTFQQVESYKYLGNWTFNSMYKTCSEKQKLCIRTAYKYKSACIYVSKMGPDIVDVIQCTWLNIAVPAILAGCESIIFSETTIEEIEKVQSQVAKFALGVPINTPNICAQSELGMKKFRHQLYNRQLGFYFRILYLPKSRWVHQALMDHLEGSWDSPYLQYISSLRRQVGLFQAPSLPVSVKGLCYENFLAQTNSILEGMEWMPKIESFTRQAYVSENQLSSVIAQFKLANEGFGNKHPIKGFSRLRYCPLCPINTLISGLHVVFICGALKPLRRNTGVALFMTQCALKGYSDDEAYRLFVNGYDSSKHLISIEAYFERAKCLNDLRSLWLSKWTENNSKSNTHDWSIDKP